MEMNQQSLLNRVTQHSFGSSVEVEQVLLDRFQRLEDEMREHYKWCKIKLHLWGAVLLVLLLVLR